MPVAHIVSHTHWDREWYLPFHRFRVQLSRVVREVLDALERDGPFEHFCLDGQAVLIEDHLEVHPEDEPRMRALVESGALAIGPWYILPDEFLVGAEATVRNLLIGHEVASRLGPVQKVGYMPDSFGHIGQMPQILRRAGIDSFVYTRGNGDEIDTLGCEYVWEAPDGSEVLAVNQIGGYCNAAGLGLEEIWHAHTQRAVDPERAVAQVRDLLKRMRERCNGEIYLLNNGCDHFPPQRDFGQVLDTLRAALPDVEFRHSSLKEFVTAIRDSGVANERHRGELLGGKFHHILSGVWSARIPLKQRNDEAQTLLADCLEPLCAYARFLLGHDYPRGEIEQAWKLLLKNHPHDSICGCSTDEVHREMETRFDGVVQTAEECIRAGLCQLAPTFARREEGDRETTLVFFNPLPEERSMVVERLVVLQPFGIDPEDLVLMDDEGRSVPFEITECRYVERFWGVDYRTELSAERQRDLFDVYLRTFGDRILKTDKSAADCFLTIRFPADLPPIGHALYRLVEGGARVAPEPGVRAQGDELENELLKVRLHPDGRFDLTDKRTGRSFNGLNALEDTEDIGDEYDFSPAEEPETVTPRPGRIRVVDDGLLSCALEAECVLSLPNAIEPGRRRRSGDRVDCPVRIRVRLTKGAPLVDVDVRIENRAEDHRLRAVFPTGVVSETVISDGHFQLVERPVERPAGEDWVQPPPATIPQCEFTMVENGLAVLARGLPEVEARREKEGVAICLTLLRCVGWLSRDDFPTRRCQNAGPTLATPDAQCRGEQRFRYAVTPDSDVKALSRLWRTPIPCVQGVADGAVPGGRGLLRKQTRETCISAVKRHESRDTLVVRLYNLSHEPVEEQLQFGFELKDAWRTDLLEERVDSLERDGSSAVRLSLRPHEICTIEVS